MLLDQVFGKDRFRNEIIWLYIPRRVSQDFQKRNDTILRYSKGVDVIFNGDSIRIAYKAGFTAVRTPQGGGSIQKKSKEIGMQKEKYQIVVGRYFQCIWLEN